MLKAHSAFFKSLPGSKMTRGLNNAHQITIQVLWECQMNRGESLHLIQHRCLIGRQNQGFCLFVCTDGRAHTHTQTLSISNLNTTPSLVHSLTRSLVHSLTRSLTPHCLWMTAQWMGDLVLAAEVRGPSPPLFPFGSYCLAGPPPRLRPIPDLLTQRQPTAKVTLHPP